MKKLFSIVLIASVMSSLQISAGEPAELIRELDKTEKAFQETDSGKTAQNDFPSEKSTVDDYINYSLLNNQELRSAFSKWQAALEKARQAGYLEEPVLSLEKTTEEVDLNYRIAITQPLPWYGKRKLRKEIGYADAEAAMHTFKAVKSEIYMMVVAVFNNYIYLARTTSITEENMRILSNLEKVIQARYESGTAEFSDLIKVQVETDKLRNELETLRNERKVRSSSLSSLLNLDTEKTLPWPTAKAETPITPPDDVLFDILEDLNPELKAMDHIVKRDELVSKLASKSYYPDFTVSAGYMVMPENEYGEQETDTSLSVGIRIPLWRNKYASERKEAEAMINNSFAHRKKLENDLRVELRTAIFKAKDALRRIRLFKDSLIPKGEQALEAATIDYTSGKAGFMTLIDAQRTLLEFRVMHARAMADAEAAMAEIGCCVGKYNTSADFHKLSKQETAKPKTRNLVEDKQ